MITERRFLGESGLIALGSQFSYQMMSFVVCKDKLILSPCVEGELCGFARKTNRYGQINIPRDALRESGIFHNTHVDMAVNGSNIVIAKVGGTAKPAIPFTDHILELDPQLTYTPAKDIITLPLNRGKQLRLPKWVMRQIGLDNDNLVVVRINNNRGIWLEVYPSTDVDGMLETRMNAVARYRKHLMSFDGLKYLEIMSGSKIHIPSSFLQLFGDNWRDSSEINLWINEEKGCIVIEGPIRECDLCTDETRSLPTALCDVQLCPDCMLPPTNGGQPLKAPPSVIPLTHGNGTGKSNVEELIETVKRVGEEQERLLKEMESIAKDDNKNDLEDFEADMFGPFVEGGHMQISVLGLSARTFHALRRHGIDTIAELCGCTEKDLMRISGFGKISLAEVTGVLVAKGLALVQEGSEIPKRVDTDDIKILQLSPKTHDVLLQNQIETISTLCKCTVIDLLDIRSFGKTCLKEVITKLDEIGLKLA